MGTGPVPRLGPPGRPGRRIATGILAGALIISAVVGFVLASFRLSGKQSNLELADQMILHLYAEHGIQVEFSSKAVELAAEITALSGRFPKPRVVVEGDFVDNVTDYSEASIPDGLGADNDVNAAWDSLDGSLDVNVILFNSTGIGSVGWSDCRNWIALFPSGFVLSELRTFLQELGHGLGLLHEKDSDIMDGGLDLREYATLTSLNASNVDSFYQGLVPDLGSGWFPWAVSERPFDVEGYDTNSTFRQVMYRESEGGDGVVVLIGGYITERSTGNQTSYYSRWETRLGDWTRAWTPLELSYLQSWDDWAPSVPPRPSIGSRITSEGCDPSRSTISNLAMDPRQWLSSMFLGSATYAGFRLLPVGRWKVREPGLHLFAKGAIRLEAHQPLAWALPAFGALLVVSFVAAGPLSVFFISLLFAWLGPIAINFAVRVRRKRVRGSDAHRLPSAERET